MKITNKKKFIVRILELITIIATIILTIVSIKYANRIRGYKAFGGEYLVPVLGLNIILVLESILEESEEKKGNRKNGKMEKERCDNEKEVFNARVNEDEMIITIDEYTTLRAAAENYEKARKEMKAHIAYLEKKLNEETEEKSNILTELETVNKENRKLKIGIINFVKGFGG